MNVDYDPTVQSTREITVPFPNRPSEKANTTDHVYCVENPRPRSMKFLVLFISLLVTTAQATDIEKEQRWAEQVVDFLIDGEAIWLNDNGRLFDS